jgi:uncharacterized protein
MNFEWGKRKNEVNIDKYGFDFADAYRIFDLPMAVEIDERDDYGEDRWIDWNARWACGGSRLYRA